MAGDCQSLPGVNCDVNNGGNDVNVGGDVNDHGDPPPPPGGHDTGNDGGGSSGGDSGGGSGDGLTDEERECVELEDEQCGRVLDDGDPEPPTVVTSSDVVSFTPPAPSISSEPEGVAIVGMPLNVVVPTEPSTSTGDLLGFAVRVRFVPERLAIDYGDGTSATTSTGSGTWSSLGQARFTSTETSHAYASRGTYTITARVLYSATVEFVGYGSVPVDGLVSSEAASTSVRAVTVDTGLVDETCAENPAGPGC